MSQEQYQDMHGSCFAGVCSMYEMTQLAKSDFIETMLAEALRLERNLKSEPFEFMTEVRRTGQ